MKVDALEADVFPLSVAILSGGASSRIGRDKALLTLGNGKTCIERVEARLASVSQDRFAVNRDGASYDGVSLRTLPDLYGKTGVLGAIGSAIRHGQHDAVFIVSCDMPFVNPEVVKLQLDSLAEYDAVVPVTSEPSRQAHESTWQVLHGLYRKSCLPAIECRLNEGNLQAISFLSLVETYPLSEVQLRRLDPQLLTCFSINTPEDLVMAQKIAGQDAS